MKLTEQQHTAFISYIFAKIEVQLSMGGEFTEEDILPEIETCKSLLGVTLDEDDFEKIKTAIEYKFKIKHSASGCIYNDYNEDRDWYSKANVKDEFFWNRYRDFLIRVEDLGVNNVNKLEHETLSNLMNCLGNPNDKIEDKRLRRGLVIGDVQSGKTATYTGLVCKAADAGYKVVILLTGITESLRKQTQERIEEGVIGCTIRVDKTGNQGVTRSSVRVGVGLDNREIRATAFTSYEDDFKVNGQIVSTISSHRSLVVFVVKKNVSVLTKLHKWLVEQNMDVLDGLIHEPMLLIDDEADNASVNTKKDKLDPSKTNKIIRQICNAFNNVTYVGFTATPFANVFIDSNTTKEMENSDLFPEHFIYVLPTPSNYIGATSIFNRDAEYYSSLKFITDIYEPDPEYIKETDPLELVEREFYHKHPKEWCGILPDSLNESLYSYFIANAIRDIRGDVSQPRTMMVNMSRFVKVQKHIKEYIEQFYKQVFDCINIDFSDNITQNKGLLVHQKFEEVWNKNFSNLGLDKNKVLSKSVLLKAIEKIQIVVVNSGKDSSKLDYKTNPSLRLIAVGGLALSRGLTLKGLMTSYFYRNTATFDVLMQMGRWFGYRYNYDDLCQIWTSETSSRWYEEISKSTEELKSDIRRMFDDKMTPKDFGLRVRDESTELQITAMNKMRNAFNYEEYINFWGGIFETPYASVNVQNNFKNIEAVKKLISNIFDLGLNFSNKRNTGNEFQSKTVIDIPRKLIEELLSQISVSIANTKFDTSNILSFIDDDNSDKLQLWDVSIQSGEGDLIYDYGRGINIRCSKRDYYINNLGNHICFTGRGTLGGNTDGQFSLTAEQVEEAKSKYNSNVNFTKKSFPNYVWFSMIESRKPLLIIYSITYDHTVNSKDKRLENYRAELGENPIVGFAIGIPANSDVSVKNKKYKLNTIAMQQRIESEGEEDEDL
ncbi:Z1 domain-containing protein [Bacteroides sp.]|uniref:Z1 domain-containing protein n=1 Tax=Bacteroides sp. TaxID=29523 RepID=UPI002FCA4CAE